MSGTSTTIPTSSSLVLDGRFDIAMRDAAGNETTVVLRTGDTFVVPRGTEHKPSSPGGAILMFEPAGTATRERSPTTWTVRPATSWTDRVQQFTGRLRARRAACPESNGGYPVVSRSTGPAPRACPIASSLVASDPEDRYLTHILGRQMLSDDPDRPSRWSAFDDLIRRHDHVNAEIVLGLGQAIVDHLQLMHRRHDRGIRPDQPGFGQQRNLDVAVACSFADAYAVAVDDDAATDDEVDWTHLVEADRRRSVRGTAASGYRLERHGQFGCVEDPVGH